MSVTATPHAGISISNRLGLRTSSGTAIAALPRRCTQHGTWDLLVAEFQVMPQFEHDHQIARRLKRIERDVTRCPWEMINSRMPSGSGLPISGCRASSMTLSLMTSMARIAAIGSRCARKSKSLSRSSYAAQARAT